MRLLTLIEQREIEQIKRDIISLNGTDKAYKITILPSERENWLNLLDIITQANEALQLEWRRSDNPKSSLRV